MSEESKNVKTAVVESVQKHHIWNEISFTWDETDDE